MGFLGTLVKSGVKINQKLQFDLKSPEEQQYQQLYALLEKAKNTAFGKFYGFEKLLKAKDVVAAYKSTVPLHNYAKMHEEWWGQQQKFADITWPGKPDYYALSSGTTGKKSKRLPITKDFVQSMRDVGTSLVRSLPNYDFPEELFESEILMLTSSANLAKHKHGHLEGEISGINVNNFPGWYDLFYRPGKEIASIDNWDERVKRIAKEAPNWNIGAVAGIPSWVMLMLQEVVNYNKASTIHDIWPNFMAYASGGVAFDTYRKDFEAICNKPVIILDTYLASEGFFSYTARPDTMSMELALSHGYYYEFIPFDERGIDDLGNILENPESHALGDVKLNQDYVLIVSTCAGAWRYIIGDTIKFTSLDPYEIKITGRTKFFLNVVGSQLSEEKMDNAIIEAGQETDVSINEYMVAAMKNDAGDYYHQWVLVVDADLDEQQFAEKLDQSLSALNKNYKVAREKALKEVRVRKISKKQYHDYLEKTKKKGGQVKTPKVMDEEKMRALLSYIN